MLKILNEVLLNEIVKTMIVRNGDNCIKEYFNKPLDSQITDILSDIKSDKTYNIDINYEKCKIEIYTKYDDMHFYNLNIVFILKDHETIESINNKIAV